MKRCFALVIALHFLVASSCFAAEETRQIGPYSANGGYTGDIRLGNTCTTSPLGRYYCGLNSTHIYFYSDNTVSVNNLYNLAAGDTGFPYILGGSWSIDNLATYRGRLGSGTKDNTTYLRGDGTWAVPPGAGAGNMLKATYDANEDGIVDSAIATAVTDGLIQNIDINASADIAGSKMLDNSVTAAKIQCSGTKSSSTYLRMDGACTTVSATPGGDNLAIQYNNDGAFGGVANSEYDSVTEILTTPALVAPSVTASQTTDPGCVKLWEGSGGGSSMTGFCAPATITDNVFYTLPSADGSDGYLLKTNGSKVLSWVAAGTATNIPTGTNPTVDAAGEIAQDTTADQVVHYGSAVRVIDYRHSENATFKSPASGDKAKWRKPYGMTVINVGCVTDAATSAVLDVQECNGNGGSCSSILSSTITCGTTYGTGTVSDSAIASGNYVYFSVGTVTGSVGYLYVNFNYSVTRE